MLNKLNAGIDLVTKNLGELYAGRTYLFAGGEKSGKTSFVLHFLHKGLKEGASCLLLAGHAPKNLVIHAGTLGIDFSPYFMGGTLLIYEFVENEKYSPAMLFAKLEKIILERKIRRFAFEFLSSPGIPSGHCAVFIREMSAFVKRIEALGVTSFFTLSLPLAPELYPLKKNLEDLSTGSFLLKARTGQVKSFEVKKLIGYPSPGAEFQFSIKQGVGIEEIAKTSRVQFPSLWRKQPTEFTPCDSGPKKREPYKAGVSFSMSGLSDKTGAGITPASFEGFQSAPQAGRGAETPSGAGAISYGIRKAAPPAGPKTEAPEQEVPQEFSAPARRHISFLAQDRGESPSGQQSGDVPATEPNLPPEDAPSSSSDADEAASRQRVRPGISFRQLKSFWIRP